MEPFGLGYSNSAERHRSALMGGACAICDANRAFRWSVIYRFKPIGTENEVEVVLKFRTGNDLGVVDWIFFGLTLVLAGIHLYLGFLDPAVTGVRAIQFILIAMAFLVGAAVYITPYWRPVLYLPGIGFALYLGILWVFSELEYVLIGVVTGVVATGFVLLGLYLFFLEVPTSSRT